MRNSHAWQTTEKSRLLLDTTRRAASIHGDCDGDVFGDDDARARVRGRSSTRSPRGRRAAFFAPRPRPHRPVASTRGTRGSSSRARRTTTATASCPTRWARWAPRSSFARACRMWTWSAGRSAGDGTGMGGRRWRGRGCASREDARGALCTSSAAPCLVRTRTSRTTRFCRGCATTRASR